MEKPYRTEIWKMFDGISSTYDWVNRAMTFGIDHYWRGRLARHLPDRPNIKLLDCATGTADQILSLMNRSKNISEAIGIDLAKAMLEVGRKKIEKTKHASKIRLETANVLDLPFEDHSFDCVTISFGIRNVTDISLGLQEMRRVLNHGGRILILECSLPKNPLLLKGHLFYLRMLLPLIGGLISRNKQAYIYLNKTIETFPFGDAFCALLTDAGFTHVQAYPFMGGAVTLYRGDKD
ncbi:MAG: bifunctional demethylmenaquinone methyltransferase/2-methoxy-6-polyprenyl-1,4-benzoquinol methylase UbiE [Chlamydiota bacterium]